LRQVANKEAKEAEKAQKALKREEKRTQKEQDKQAKATLALKRKKEQEERRELAVAVQLAIASNAQTQRLSAGPSTTRNARKIPTTRVAKPTKGSQRRVSTKGLNEGSNAHLGRLLHLLQTLPTLLPQGPKNAANTAEGLPCHSALRNRAQIDQLATQLSILVIYEISIN
jgi:hypothetical protein